MPKKKNDEPPTRYSLAQVAVIFKLTPATIRGRCAKGDFDYIVDGNGRTYITRESVLKHLPELEMKHNK